MRTYYRGPDALVTDEHLIWRVAAGRTRSFVIRDLHHVGLARADADRRPDVAVVAAAALVAFAGTAWLTTGPVIGMAAGFVALIAAAVAVSTRQHRAVQTWQVHAAYRGVDTVVYESADVRVFNQVTRALRRSIEDDRAEPSTYGLAAA
jgi:hypothetical protein